jgi:hypothetical protein
MMIMRTGLCGEKRLAGETLTACLVVGGFATREAVWMRIQAGMSPVVEPRGMHGFVRTMAEPHFSGASVESGCSHRENDEGVTMPFTLIMICFLVFDSGLHSPFVLKDRLPKRSAQLLYLHKKKNKASGGFLVYKVWTGHRSALSTQQRAILLVVA